MPASIAISDVIITCYTLIFRCRTMPGLFLTLIFLTAACRRHVAVTSRHTHIHTDDTCVQHRNVARCAGCRRRTISSHLWLVCVCVCHDRRVVSRCAGCDLVGRKPPSPHRAPHSPAAAAAMAIASHLRHATSCDVTCAL